MSRFSQRLGNHTIVKQYAILNECLHMIGRTSIRRVDKIRIEAKIIRLQSLLLSASSPLVGEGPGEEDPFEALLRQLRLLPPGVREDDTALQAFKERLRSLLAGLGRDPLAS